MYASVTGVLYLLSLVLETTLFFTSCSLVPFADDTDLAEITLPSSFFQCKLHRNTLKDDDDGDDRDELSNLHLRHRVSLSRCFSL